MEITRGKQAKAQRVVIYGPEGIGKTSLAARFPNPLFIDLEDGSATFDVARAPKPAKWGEFKATLKDFATDKQGFRAVVIDTADWAETMCTAYICDVHTHKGIEDFGYGKGYTYLYEEWGKLLDFLTKLRNDGIHVVMLAHAHMRKVEQPDEAGAYDRWELKLSKKVAQLTKEWADMVLFANYRTQVIEIDGSKKAQGGKRVMYTTHHPCWDAKNRHGLPECLPLDFASIAGCFNVETAPGPAPQTEPTPEPEPQPETKYKENEAAFPAQLWNLMTLTGVASEDIEALCVAKGYMPKGVPLENYPDELTDKICANWEVPGGVLEQIRKMKGANNG